MCLYSVRSGVSSQHFQSQQCTHQALKAVCDHDSKKASGRDKLINQGQLCLCSSSTRMAPMILFPTLPLVFFLFFCSLSLAALFKVTNGLNLQQMQEIVSFDSY